MWQGEAWPEKTAHTGEYWARWNYTNDRCWWRLMRGGKFFIDYQPPPEPAYAGSLELVVAKP